MGTCCASKKPANPGHLNQNKASSQNHPENTQNQYNQQGQPYLSNTYFAGNVDVGAGKVPNGAGYSKDGQLNTQYSNVGPYQQQEPFNSKVGGAYPNNNAGYPQPDRAQPQHPYADPAGSNFHAPQDSKINQNTLYYPVNEPSRENPVHPVQANSMMNDAKLPEVSQIQEKQFQPGVRVYGSEQNLQGVNEKFQIPFVQIAIAKK